MVIIKIKITKITAILAIKLLKNFVKVEEIVFFVHFRLNFI